MLGRFQALNASFWMSYFTISLVNSAQLIPAYLSAPYYDFTKQTETDNYRFRQGDRHHQRAGFVFWNRKNLERATAMKEVIDMGKMKTPGNPEWKDGETVYSACINEFIAMPQSKKPWSFSFPNAFWRTGFRPPHCRSKLTHYFRQSDK